MPDLSPLPGGRISIHAAEAIAMPFQGQDPACSPLRGVKTELELCKLSHFDFSPELLPQ